MRLTPSRHPVAAVTLVFALLVIACGGRQAEGPEAEIAAPPPAAPPPAPAWREVAGEVGLDFEQRTGQGTTRRLLAITGVGAGLLDIDRDGDLDVFLLQGRPLEEGLEPPPGGWHDRFYRNLLQETGELRFRDDTSQLGFSSDGEHYPLGLAAGYADDDAAWDLLVTGLGPDRLFLQATDGFERVELPASEGLTTGASFADLDRDGDQELYVARYAHYTIADDRGCRGPTGAPDYCGPASFEGRDDLVLQSDGEGGWSDVSDEWGVRGPQLHGLGTAVVDLEGDLWPDLFVANDGDVNLLWRNREGQGFEEVALGAGVALNAQGRAEAGMGIAAADLDGDGAEDLFLTHLGRETNTFYRRRGPGGGFTDASAASGLAAPSLPYTGFGVAALDLENDGDLDLFVANGAVRAIESQLRAGDPFPLREPYQLFRNRGDGRFEEWEAPGLPAGPRIGRGVAAGDVDSDGDTDLLVVSLEGTVELLRNELGQAGRWLGLELVDTSGRIALGAEATLELAGGSTSTRRVRVDAGFLSIQDPRLLFGLGEGVPSRLHVRWPSGRIESLAPPAPGGYWRLEEGSRRFTPLPAPAAGGR